MTLFRCCMTLCIMTLVAAIRVSDACCCLHNDTTIVSEHHGNLMETKWKPSGAFQGRFQEGFGEP